MFKFLKKKMNLSVEKVNEIRTFINSYKGNENEVLVKKVSL